MKRLALIIVLIVTLFAGAVAQDHKERTAPPSPAIAGEYRYISDEGRYSVVVPNEPKLSTQDISPSSGGQLTQYLATVVDGNGAFMVAYFDYPSGVDFSLDKGRDGMVQSLNGTLLDEHSISLGGAPGREIKISATTDAGVSFIDRVRFYDVSPRVYVLQCLFPQKGDGPAIAERCEAFFDSFKVRSGR